MKRIGFFDKNGTRLPVTKCKRPKFSCHGGRTWDCFTISIDGQKQDCWLDTTWGFYFYFIYDGSYRKCKMQSDWKDIHIKKKNGMLTQQKELQRFLQKNLRNIWKFEINVLSL